MAANRTLDCARKTDTRGSSRNGRIALCPSPPGTARSRAWSRWPAGFEFIKVSGQDSFCCKFNQEGEYSTSYSVSRPFTDLLTDNRGYDTAEGQSDMLYLVSGASRSGKTLIEKKILADKQIPYLSLDWLMMGFNSGIPEYGIHHLLWPNEIAEKMAPFLGGMIDCMLVDGMDYVIEGEAMLPQWVAELVDKHPGKIRAVFVGYTEINVEDKLARIRKHANVETDWLTKESDEYIRDHVGNMIAYSKMIRNECQRHELPYFDTSDDFLGAIEAATDLLVGDLG